MPDNDTPQDLRDRITAVPQQILDEQEIEAQNMAPDLPEGETQALETPGNVTGAS